jgi:hypothetical protein
MYKVRNMKKALFLASLVLMSTAVMSQDKKYVKAMEAAMEEMQQAGDPASVLALAAEFEKIAEAYPDQWLPCYHAARILLTSGFGETEATQKDALVERAKDHVTKAETLVPAESEVQVLKALYFIGLIAVEPDIRGPIYYIDAMDAIQKGLDLNPENPRAHYMNGMWTLNTPDFMGGGPEPAKPLLEEALDKFKNFENDDPFWPAWGEDLVQGELDRMN